ncbi:MAG: hypothetical protein GXO03_06210, partial [Aquificae bacterium]|nr:hypothetical protein [Aquificota bacterium]
QRYFSELKRVRADERTPYLYAKVKGYHEGMKTFAYYAHEEGVKTAHSYLKENAEKALRGSYANREPATELIVFVPKVTFEEYCHDDDCFYEKVVEKERYLRLVGYEDLKRRIKFLRSEKAYKCAPYEYGKAEALFNLISLELMRKKPNEEVLVSLRRQLTPVLAEAEERVRQFMRKGERCGN